MFRNPVQKYFRFWLCTTLFVITSSFGIAQSTSSVPVVTWIQPTNGSTFAAGAPILMRARATDSDGTVSFVEFFANTSRLARVTFGSSNVYTFVWSNAPAGTHQLHAEAVDNAAGRGVSSSVQIVVGGGITNPPPTNSAPVVTWMQPTNGSTFPLGAPILMRARATDSDGTVSFVDFFANTSRLARVTFGSSNVYSFVWSNAPAGTHQLHAEAVDNAAGRGVSGFVQIVVGGGVTNPPPTNSAPLVTWIQPTNGSTFPVGSPILMRARATDSDGTVSFVDFFANTSRLARVTFGSSNVYSFVWSNAPAGTHELHAEAVDNVGGRGISGSVHIVVGTNGPPSNVVPAVTWLQPANGSSFAVGAPILMRARATDSDGTVSFVEFFANTTRLAQVSTSSSNVYSFIWSNAPAGTHQLHAEAVDNAGGRGISGSVQITVGGGGGGTNAPPTIVSHPQSQTVTNGSDVTFSVTATGTPPLSYRWRKGSSFIPGATNSTLTLFNVTSNDAGFYGVLVTNMFGSRLSSNAVLTVISSGSNLPPTVTLTSPTNGAVFRARQPIFLRAQASDPDGTVSFVDFFANTTRVARAFSSTGTFSSVWSNAAPGNYEIRAVATDNQGTQGSSEPASITVLSNRPPTAHDQSVTVQEDSSTAITLTGSDPDGDFLTFTVLTLPTHGTLGGSPPSLTYTPDANYSGPDGFTFSVRDREFQSAPATVQIAVTPVNDAPVARIEIENTVIFLENLAIITLDASSGTVILDGSDSFDPDNDPLTYTWLVGEPPEAFATDVRVITEVPAGSHVFQLQLSDGELTGTAQAAIDVLTPCDAIALLIVRIEASSHPTKTKRSLIHTLEMSCDNFDRGNVERGIDILRVFQGKVAIQLGQIDPAFAELLINAAQTLIDSVPTQ